VALWTNCPGKLLGIHVVPELKKMMDCFSQHSAEIQVAAAIVQAISALVIVGLTVCLARSTGIYARLTKDSLEVARRQFEREWLPHWHLAMQNVERGVTRLQVFNLSKNSSHVTHLRVRVETEPHSVKQFDLDLPMLGQHREQVESNISAYILETVRPLALEGAWQGVLEIAVVFLLAHTDEPRPSKWFPYRIAVRNGEITELRSKMPFIAADLSE
jgi:hypothetical protein